jgi:type II secretion system protein H
MRPSPPDKPALAAAGRAGRRPRAGGFTLIELLLVMVLLTIVMALTAPRMISFFRGRALSQESRRILALAHYARSRAVAESEPVVLWFDPATSTYGQNLQAGFSGADARASRFALDASLTLETPAEETPPTSENGDELLGLPANLAVIRFTPDGFYDPGSVARLVLRQGTEGALQIVPTANRLDYEILPYTSN